MKAVGLVVEYNPFHNGHKYHAAESRLQNGADAVVAVMSGSFLQRGEPALVDKWTRTEMALRNGVDLVVELPYIYSTQHAEYFAAGAIRILDALRCDSFCFGSEDDSIGKFLSIHEKITANQARLDALVKAFSKEGHNYPKSMSLAMKELGLANENGLDLSKPNNILGLQYVKAALTGPYTIKPTLINRIAAGYHDSDLPDGEIASATSIRNALMGTGGDDKAVHSYVPESAFAALSAYKARTGILHHWELYWPFLKYRLISDGPDRLESVYEVEEGIHHRLKEAALYSETFAQFIAKAKTKRYTHTRLQRICVHILNGTDKNTVKSHMKDDPYIRILGFNDTGRAYLNEKKKDITLPVISRAAASDHGALAMDLKSSFIHAMALSPDKQNDVIKREYGSPVILNDRLT
ncbi:MAG: nucleotidyltransferase [Bacillus sp. (in: firmicutes)]